MATNTHAKELAKANAGYPLGGQDPSGSGREKGQYNTGGGQSMKKQSAKSKTDAGLAAARKKQKRHLKKKTNSHPNPGNPHEGGY